MERSEVEAKYKWKTEDIFSSDEAWEKCFAEAEKLLDFSAFEGKLSDAGKFAAFLARQEEAGKKAERLYLYAIPASQNTRRCSRGRCRSMCAFPRRRLLPNRN